MKKINKVLTGSILLYLITTSLHAQESTDKFVPSFKLFAQVFGDYYYKIGSDTNATWGNTEFAKDPKDYQAFSFRRVYFGGVFELSEKFEGKVMYEGSDGNLLGNGKKAAGNLKYAYLKWKGIYHNADLYIGAQSSPTWSRFTEKIWKYRSIEKTIADARGLGGSNDVGVSLSGKFNDDKTIGYELMIGNGRGQKPEDNWYKKYYAAVNARLMDKKVLLEIYTDYEDQDKYGKSKMTLKGFVGYQTEKLTVGVEIVNQNQANFGTSLDTVTGKIDTVAVVPFGTSFFVRGSVIADKLNAFARVDIYNPDTKISDSGFNEIFGVVGLDYTPTKNVHIMPNFWFNTYTNKDATSGAMKRTPDLVARLTFEFKF